MDLISGINSNQNSADTNAGPECQEPLRTVGCPESDVGILLNAHGHEHLGYAVNVISELAVCSCVVTHCVSKSGLIRELGRDLVEHLTECHVNEDVLFKHSLALAFFNVLDVGRNDLDRSLRTNLCLCLLLRRFDDLLCALGLFPCSYEVDELREYDRRALDLLCPSLYPLEGYESVVAVLIKQLEKRLQREIAVTRQTVRDGTVFFLNGILHVDVADILTDVCPSCLDGLAEITERVMNVPQYFYIRRIYCLDEFSQTGCICIHTVGLNEEGNVLAFAERSQILEDRNDLFVIDFAFRCRMRVSKDTNVGSTALICQCYIFTDLRRRDLSAVFVSQYTVRGEAWNLQTELSKVFHGAVHFRRKERLCVRRSDLFTQSTDLNAGVAKVMGHRIDVLPGPLGACQCGKCQFHSHFENLRLKKP